MIEITGKNESGENYLNGCMLLSNMNEALDYIDNVHKRYNTQFNGKFGYWDGKKKPEFKCVEKK